MAEVKMRTAAASATWSAQPGQVVSVSDAEAAQLVEGGFAELVGSAGDGEAGAADGAGDDAAAKPEKKKKS